MKVLFQVFGAEFLTKAITCLFCCVFVWKSGWLGAGCSMEVSSLMKGDLSLHHRVSMLNAALSNSPLFVSRHLGFRWLSVSTAVNNLCCLWNFVNYFPVAGLYILQRNVDECLLAKQKGYSPGKNKGRRVNRMSVVWSRLSLGVCYF